MREHIASIIVTTPEGERNVVAFALKTKCETDWHKMAGFRPGSRFVMIYITRVERRQRVLGQLALLVAAEHFSWGRGAHVSWMAA